MNLQNQLDYLPTLLDGCSVVPSPIDPDLVRSQIMLECGLLTPLYSEPAVMKAAIKQWFNTRSWTFQHLVNIILAEYNPIENYDRREESTKNISNIRDIKETLSGKDQRDFDEKLTGTDKRDINEMQSGTDMHDLTEISSGTDQRDITETLSNTDTTERSVEGDLVTEEEVSPYNSSSYINSQQSTVTDGQIITTETTYGKTTTTDDDVTYGKTITTNDDVTYGKSITTDDDITYGKITTVNDDTTYGKTTTTDDDSLGIENVNSHIHGNIGVTTNQQMIEQELALLSEFDIYNWIAKEFRSDLMLEIY